MAEDINLTRGDIMNKRSQITTEMSEANLDNEKYSTFLHHMKGTKYLLTEEEARNHLLEETLEFPRPIVVPKIEINEEIRKVPVVVDMLDLDTENESSDVDDIYFSNKCVGSHDNIINNINSYGTEEKKISIKQITEEVDLGTNIVTEEGDIKISGLADNLGLHLPKIVGVFSENSESIKNNDFNTDKSPSRSVAVKKTSNSFISCREILKNMLEPSNRVLDKTISNVNKSKQVEFFGNKIIIGSKPNVVKRSPKPELRIVLKDCYQDYINNHNYCSDCDVMFTTYKAFDVHYITQHLNNKNNKDIDEKSSSDNDNYSQDNVKVDNDINSKIKPKPCPKRRKITSKSKTVKFKCKICNTIFTQKFNLKRHLRNVHNLELHPDLCEDIYINTPTENHEGNIAKSKKSVQLQKHRSTSSDDDRSSDSDAVVSSKIKVKKVSKTTGQVKVKAVTKKSNPNNIDALLSKIKENHCFHCDKTFENKEEIINHLYTLLLPKLYTCDVCSEEFISEDILKTHAKCHLNNEKIKEAKIAIVKLSKAEIERYLSKSAIHNKEREENSNSVDGLNKSSFSDDSYDDRDYCISPDGVESDDSDSSNKSSNADVDKPLKITSKTISKRKPPKIKTKNNSTGMKKYRNSLTNSSDSEEDAQPLVNIKKCCRPKSRKKESSKNQLLKDNKNLKNLENDDKPLKPKVDLKSQPKSILEINKTHVIGADSSTKEVSSSKLPIPKSILFKCKVCKLHFYSCLSAYTHVSICKFQCDDLMVTRWVCPVCNKHFDVENKAIHVQQHAASNNEKFHVYSISEDEMNIHKKILHCCPNCSVHFLENKFQNHFKTCDDDVVDSFYCPKCDILIAKEHKIYHSKCHDNNNFTVDDFIIIVYDVADIAMNNADEKSEDSSVGNNRKRKLILTSVDNKTKQMKIELVDKIYNEDNFKDFIKLLHCSTCESYISPYVLLSYVHIDKKCNELDKTICTLCGLSFASSDRDSHQNLHNNPEFSIYNILIYNMDYQQIDPPMPKLPKCDTCLINFESEASRSNHDCGKLKYKACFYCGENFNKLAYNMHIKFHDYANKRPKAPLSVNEINKFQTNKKISLFDFYQCIKCGVLLDGDVYKSHRVADGDCRLSKRNYKKCEGCGLIFSSTDYYNHLTKHAKDPNFKLENFNVIKFLPEIDTYYQCKKCKMCSINPKGNHYCESKNRIYCNKCKVYINDKFRCHLQLHEVYTHLSAKTVKLIPMDFAVNKRYPKNKSKSKTQATKLKKNIVPDLNLDTSDDSDSKIIHFKEIEKYDKKNSSEITHEVPTHYKCRNCNVVIIEGHASHKCDSVTELKTCRICELSLVNSEYDRHLETHAKHPGVYIENELVEFGEDFGKYRARDDDPNAVELYKCLCGLHFLTETGIYDHYAQCDSKIRICKQNCTKCNLLFTPPVLFNHLITHHSTNKEFKYKVVDMTFYKSELRDDVFMCDKCKVNFVVKAVCEKHRQNCKGIKYDNAKLCSDCEMCYHNDMFMLHKKKHHTNRLYTKESLDIVVIQDDENITKSNKADKDISKNNIETNCNDKLEAIKLLQLDTSNKVETNGDVNIVLRQNKDQILEGANLASYTNRIYQCKRCDLNFTMARSFRSHIAKNHNTSNITIRRCKVCALRFSVIICEKHELIHHDRLKLNYEDFIFKFTPDGDYIARFRGPPKLTDEAKAKIDRNKEYDSNQLFKCSQCEIYFLTPNTHYYHVHKFKHNLKLPKVKCEKCKIYMPSTTLLRHNYIHHYKNNFDLKDLEIVTDYPHSYLKGVRSYLDKSAIVLSKYSNKIYKCNKCNICFCTASALAKHIVQDEHKLRNQTQTCDECNENFTSLFYSRHKFIHHENFKLKKEDYEYINEDTLDLILAKRKINKEIQNKLKENNKKAILYRCVECCVCVLTQDHIHRHVNFDHKLLSDELKEKCSDCGIVFKRSLLKRHRALHHYHRSLELDDFLIVDCEVTLFDDEKINIVDKHDVFFNKNDDLRNVEDDENSGKDKEIENNHDIRDEEM